jgi:hypothetical protein
VEVLSFAGALPGLIAFVRVWQRQHRGATITLEIDGDRLTLPVEQRLIDEWISRHGG